MNLTSENTAIVLDSTSDYPDAPARFPNMRFVPLYVRFGDETYRDYVELGPAAFYEKLRVSPVTPATAQPTPQDFVSAYEELAAYERIYSLHVSSKVSGTFQSAELAAQEIGGDRVRVDRHDDCLARHRDALPRDPAPARARDDGRGDLGVDRPFPRALRRALHRGDARVPAARRSHREGAGARGLAAQPATGARVSRTARSLRSARVRGKQKALAEFERRFVAATTDGPGLRVAIAHADAEEWVGTLSELAWRVRPNAEIEFTSTLGAVVGTHAGPGAVGFFWFQDTD